MQGLRDLAVFVAVARAGSFKAAAIDLDMQTSTVSRRIAALEKHLGLRLFERTTRSVSLTEAGRHLQTGADKLITETAELTRDVQQSAQAAAGLIRIAAPLEFTEICLAPVIAAFIDEFPSISVEIVASPRMVDLIAERFDVAIRYGTVKSETFAVRRLCTTPVRLFASLEYLETYGVPSRPEDLIHHTCIVCTGKWAADDYTLTRQGDRRTAQLGRQLQVNTRLLAKA